MDINQIHQQLSPHERIAYVPEVEEGDGSLTDSKFSGIPYLTDDWPRCPLCSQPIQLFLQLNLAQLPILPPHCPTNGLLQFFYCTNDEEVCEDQCEAFMPFAESVLVRIVPIKGPGRVFDRSPVSNPFPAKRITGWTQRKDLPGWVETTELGFEFSYQEGRLMDEEYDYPIIGEKYLGWPAWVQGVEYPDCPECGEQMVYLFQIDSDGHLPWMFGDTGCGHITQCVNHPEVLAFAWACC